MKRKEKKNKNRKQKEGSVKREEEIILWQRIAHAQALTAGSATKREAHMGISASNNWSVFRQL